MKRSIGLWQFLGFAVTSFLGTVLHFLYDWLGGAVWIAPFAAVNESTFEHMKLLFWPMLLFALIEGRFLQRENFLCVKLRGITLGLLLIPVLFYTYNGVIGPSPAFVNIGIFFLAAAAAYLYETRLLRAESPSSCRKGAARAVLLLLAAAFVLFTFKAPMLAIFRDPISGTYGI